MRSNTSKTSKHGKWELKDWLSPVVAIVAVFVSYYFGQQSTNLDQLSTEYQFKQLQMQHVGWLTPLPNISAIPVIDDSVLIKGKLYEDGRVTIDSSATINYRIKIGFNLVNRSELPIQIVFEARKESWSLKRDIWDNFDLIARIPDEAKPGIRREIGLHPLIVEPGDTLQISELCKTEKSDSLGNTGQQFFFIFQTPYGGISALYIWMNVVDAIGPKRGAEGAVFPAERRVLIKFPNTEARIHAYEYLVFDQEDLERLYSIRNQPISDQNLELIEALEQLKRFTR